MDHQKQDRTEKLTQEELSLLIKVKNVTRNLILFVGIASIALLLLSPNVISGINSSIIIISALITILIIVLAMFILLGNIKRDIKNEIKIIQIGRVEEKILGNARSFVIVVNGERRLITREHYEMLSINDTVEISESPLSHTLLHLRKIE